MKTFFKKIYSRLPFKKEFFALIRFLKPPEYLFRHLHFRGAFSVQAGSSSFKMMHYGYQIENELFWQGIKNAWEKKSIDLWVQFASQAEVILDIGANTGIYSLLAKCVKPKSTVYAFEPVGRVYEKLTYNSTLNQFNIHCIKAAISDTDGQGSIYDTMEEHILSVTVNKNLNTEMKKVHETKIDLMRLDTFIHKNNISRVDLMKVDVETHEPQVLKGMGEFLGKFRPVLIIEILDDKTGREIETIISPLGYLYFNIDDKNSKIEKQDHITQSFHFNYLLCPVEKTESINL